MGSDKALLPWGDSSLLDHQAGILRATGAGELILACRSDQRHDLPDFRRVADAQPGAGPLAALANIWMGSPAEVLLVLAIDLPFVPTDRLRTMAGLARQEGRSVMPHRNGRFEPLAAAWHRSCLPTMQHTLAAGQRSFQPLCADLLAAGRLRPLASDDPGAQWLANLNRPEDLLPSAPAGRSFPGNR